MPRQTSCDQTAYRRYRALAIEAYSGGRPHKAEGLFFKALEAARRGGDQDLEDIAFCNWAGAKAALRDVQGLLAPLGEILVRSRHPANRRLAAYNMSLVYEHRRELDKGLFYARIAQEQSCQMERPEPRWVASAHNQIGNFLVADSRFSEALGNLWFAADLLLTVDVRQLINLGA
jgi:hypothetical protein